jgi:hypothetical protein
VVRLVAVAGVLLAGCLSKPAAPNEGDGFDEDGDGVPNQADRCPGRAGPDADLDDDGDGIGDGCDPEAGFDNTRLFFQGFDAVACGDAELVYCDAGSIDLVNGWYRYSVDARGSAMFAGDHDRVAVTIAVDTFERDDQQTWNEVGIVLCGAPSATEDVVQGVQAIVGTMGGTEYVEYYEQTDGQNDDIHGHAELSDLDLDVPVPGIELTCELRLPSATCVLRHAGVSTTFAATSIARGPGQLGIFGNHLASRIRYIDVVALAP